MPSPDSPEDGTTDSTATRWDYTNDLLAAWLIVSFSVTAWLHMFRLLDLARLPGTVFALYASLTGIAVAWAFGPDAVAAWKKQQ